MTNSGTRIERFCFSHRIHTPKLYPHLKQHSRRLSILPGANNKATPIMSKKSAEPAPPAPDSRWHQELDINTNASEHTANLHQSTPTNSDAVSNASVTIKPAKHLANSFSLYSNDPRTAEGILTSLLPQDDTRGQLIQSSFQDGADASFSPTTNGFVDTAMQAYNQHQHLIIRPEDIWLSVLTQLSCYINAHSEELRGSFVAHEGKKKLEIKYAGGNRFTAGWADFAYKIGTMIQDNVVDPELREWMMPAFTTTTSHDVVIASIVMMASMQKYFSYSCCICCGIPSVTLLGNKADYELILQRLSKLRNYGKEPNIFVDLLTPVMKRFIRSFDEPESEDTLDFWNRIFSSSNMGSGPDYYSGWITSFLFWDKEGKLLYHEPRSYDDDDKRDPPLSLDGVKYPTINADLVPPGFCTVPVEINDNGEEIKAEMLAGSIGHDCTSSGGAVADPEKGKLDTLQARSGWWIYEKRPEEEVEAERKARHDKMMAEFEEMRAKWKQ